MTIIPFQTSQSYAAGTYRNPAAGEVTVPANVAGFDAQYTIGPASNPATTVDIQVFVNGVVKHHAQFTGGLTNSVKNGPADTPASLTGQANVIAPTGSQVHVLTVVTGPVSVNISVQGSTF